MPGKMLQSACPTCRQGTSVFQRSRKPANIHTDSGVVCGIQLIAVTYAIVLPFDRGENGALKLGEPQEAPDLVQPSADGASRITIGAER